MHRVNGVSFQNEWHYIRVFINLLPLSYMYMYIYIYIYVCVCVCVCAGGCSVLTHWGRVTHICVGNLTIIVSDNGLSPGRRQAIIWTNAGILLIGPWGTNFSEILIGIQTFSFTKIHLKMSSAKWRPFCPGLNVLNLPASRVCECYRMRNSLTFIL